MKLIKKSLSALALAAVAAGCLFGGTAGFAPNETKAYAAENTINVWLIGGQSNAVGYAQDSPSRTDERYTAGFDNVLFWGDYEYDSTSPNKPPTDFVPVRMGLGKLYSGGTVCSGAELGIASALADSGTMNAVIKCAYGATFLYPDTTASISQTRGTWTPPSYLEAHPTVNSTGKIGACYSLFLQTVREGLRRLTARGYTPVLRGMWWMQGEADIISTTYTNAYSELLTTLISDLRTDLSEIADSDLSDLPFVIGKIYRNPDPVYTMSTASTNGIAAIRAIQQSVADSVFNVFAVDCTGLVQHDGWHFNADGQVWLGEQFVSTVLTNEGSYQISVTGDTSHIAVTGGGVKQAGDTVTVTCTPTRGYRVGKLTYAEDAGDAREVALINGKYTFIMPQAHVSLTVTEEALPMHTLTYTVNDANMGSVYVSYPSAGEKGWYDGESVQVGVLPKAGYAVSSVKANGTVLTSSGKVGEGYAYSVSVDGDVSIEVVFISEEPTGGGENINPPAPEQSPERQGGLGGLGIGLIVGGVVILCSASAVVTVFCIKKKKK